MYMYVWRFAIQICTSICDIRLMVTALVDGPCCLQSIVVYERRQFCKFLCHLCFEYLPSIWDLHSCLASFDSIYGIKPYLKISLQRLLICLFPYMLIKRLSCIRNIKQGHPIWYMQGFFLDHDNVHCNVSAIYYTTVAIAWSYRHY